MKIVLAQTTRNLLEIASNYQNIVKNISKAGNKADLIVFPELSIQWIAPLEDLVFKR